MTPKNAVTAFVVSARCSLGILWLSLLLTPAAFAIFKSPTLRACSLLLASTPHVQKQISYQLSPKSHIRAHGNDTSSFTALNENEQMASRDFLAMLKDYQFDYSQHSNRLAAAASPEELRTAHALWQDTLVPYSDALLGIPLTTRLKLLASMFFDARYSNQEATQIINMINTVSRPTYQRLSDSLEVREQRAKEHILISYIIAVFRNYENLDIYRNQIVQSFPQLQSLPLNDNVILHYFLSN